MYRRPIRYCLLLLCLSIVAGCANIVPPSGGIKDVAPPKLISVTPADSLTGVRTTRFTLLFNEYIILSDPATQIRISPLLPIPLNVTSLNKHVTITIPDTLLLENTTYRVTFGNAIRDLHEGNIYNGNGYIFSTGAYFDSLRIQGRVYNAATGLPDSSASVLLYNASEGDSAIVRHKPLYVTHADASGNFTFEGLPSRSFRIYALRESNGNLIYDGGKEWIGFIDAPVQPRPDTTLSFVLRTFQEEDADTVKSGSGANKLFADRPTSPATQKGGISYEVLADTSDPRRRTQEITRPLVIRFSRKPGVINPGKLYLTYDSTGITVEALIQVVFDTGRMQLSIRTDWKEATLYTLRLQKGFVKDSAGNDLLPGRYTFRTKRDEDYARLRIDMPAKYLGKGFVLQVTNETDTIYQQPVPEPVVNLLRVQPGNYTLRVIEDRNHNGRWDAGDLFRKRQPELVIPYLLPIRLKPGWEDRIDFEPAPSGPAPGRKGGP